MAPAPLKKKDFQTLSDFRYQLRRFIRWSEERTHEHGITNLQYLLMLHIKGTPDRDWASIGELAERLQAHHHGVVALVNRSEKLGFVRKVRGRTDRRVAEVRLTPKGRRLVERLARLHRDELLRLQGVLAIPGRRQFPGP
jgi:DNA-binding MarR family transcriptional regulator